MADDSMLSPLLIFHYLLHIVEVKICSDDNVCSVVSRGYLKYRIYFLQYCRTLRNKVTLRTNVLN